MTYEISCGAVVFTRQNGDLRYVLTQSIEGFWGFPKGHMEAGETEAQTALREIREETGLSVTLVDGFRTVEEHLLPQKPGVMKRVIYFAASYQDQTFTPQETEVKSIRLASYAEAVALFQFESNKRVLQEAHSFLAQ